MGLNYPIFILQMMSLFLPSSRTCALEDGVKGHIFQTGGELAEDKRPSFWKAGRMSIEPSKR